MITKSRGVYIDECRSVCAELVTGHSRLKPESHAYMKGRRVHSSIQHICARPVVYTLPNFGKTSAREKLGAHARKEKDKRERERDKNK